MTRPAHLSPAQQALLARLRKGEAARSGPAIPRTGSAGPFPLSYAQERIWFTGQLAPGMRLYNLMGGIRLPGTIEVGELELRLAATIRRHDAMRTSVRLVSGEPRLVVAPSVPATVQLADLSSADPADTDELARKAVMDICGAPYQLDRAPLWRVGLVWLPAGEQMLVLGGHHLVIDGVSLSLIGHELLIPAERPAPPIGYADYATWQKGLVASGGIDGELDYWRQQLASLPAPLDLSLGRHRPAKRTLRGATIGAGVPEATMRRVRKLSQDAGVTIYTTFLAAFVVLLRRWSGRDDILVGTSVSGRTMPELYNMVGMFMNMVALRFDLTRPVSFRDLLAEAGQTLTTGLSNPNVPFELLVNELRLSGGRSHPPLIQVGFNMPMGEFTSEVRLVDMPFAVEGAQLDLTVHLQPRGGEGMELLFEYASDLFDEPVIRDMIDRYLLLTGELTAAPGRLFTEASLLWPGERELLAAGRGPSPAPGPAEPAGPPPATPLHRLVIAQAGRTPDQTAVISDDETLTYAGLAARANGVACELRRLGVGAETLVGVLIRPGPGLAVALLAVWLAGGAFVPLDPDQPAARAALILADAKAPVVLTQRELAGSLPAGPHTVLPVEDVLPGDQPPPEVATSASAAYVLYTSGSTGRPKGVVVTHGGIVNRVLWTVREHQIGPADRVLQKTRLTFDAAIWEFFAPLVSGGAVVMAPPGADRDPAVLLRAVADHEITVLQVVPSVLRLLAGSGDWPDSRPLRLLFCAGEPLDGELCARIVELTGAGIINTYGPTECAIDVAAARYVPAYRYDPVPIGRPIDHTRLLVLDRSGEPLPAGLAGELYVGGAGLARGYLGRPDLTAAAFLPDHLGPSGGRLYRTGDLARWRPDGELEFLGRQDHQVKVNGVRIELGEVEAVLAAHPAVRGAVVTAPADGSGQRRLVAYVAGDAAGPELRAFLQNQLPSPMIPGLFVKLDAIPLTPNGKADRAALPVPDSNARPDGQPYLAPRDSVEAEISAIWSGLLDAGPVGVHDDFFALGGHSLLLTRLVAELQDRLGATVTVADLFGAPVLADQARLVGESLSSPLDPIRPAGRGELLPLSPGQGRLWFLHQLDPCDVNYNVPMALQLRGELHVPALQAALDGVVARHEVLRTTVGTGPDGSGYQVIHPPAPVPLTQADLTGLPLDQAREQARSLLDADASRPFDLAAGPVLRVQLIRLAAGEFMLGITFHHIASDGWSAVVFRQELAALYAAHRGGRPPGLPPLPLQYADYAAWQHRFLSGDRMRRQVGYWRDRLAGLSTVALPTDWRRPARISSPAAYCVFTVPAKTANQLRELARRAAASMFMTLLAGFQALLSLYTGQHDIVVGTAVAGRGHPETERLIGFFVNTLVLRTDLSGDPTLTELLARVREMTLGAYAHQDLPFEHLVTELQPARDISRHPIFQIMFEMMTRDPNPQLTGLATLPLWEETKARTAKFDLTVALDEQDDGSLLGYVEYAADLFRQPTIERMLGHYVTLLTSVANDPGQYLSGVRMLSAAERDQLTAWSTGPVIPSAPARAPAASPAADPAAGSPVPDLVAAAAAAAPDAAALLAGGHRVTYRELTDLAGRLAGRLAGCGVRPNSVVGLALDGIDFVVAALAVLQAGGAYLPLDPAQPADRLGLMLGSAGATTVVTSAGLRGRLPDRLDAEVLLLPDPGAGPDSGERTPDGTPRTPAGTPRAPVHPAGPVHPESTAYVIYTSGSTGTPKAVLVSHRALANSMAARRKYYREPVGTFLLLSPVIFDSSVAGIFWTLCSGGTLLLPGDDRRALVDEIAGDIAEHQVTHVVAVPSLLRELADWHQAATRPPLASLRVIIAAGEACPADLAARLSAVAPGAALFNEYGPTEAGIWVSAARLRPSQDDVPAIGAPIANTVCYVLDAQLRPVPPGVPGELWLGGAGLAHGYAAHPALTAERFVANPLGCDGSRLYRSGDLARWRPDGQLEYLGRIDDQVKIAGHRIEPAEIEATLLAHPQVSAVAVVAPPAVQPGDRLLAAYVVPADPARPATAGELRTHCRARLPGYLIPASFVTIGALPRTATGKTDRAALASQGSGAPDASTGDDGPRTEVERQVAGIWCEVLGLDRVGVHDDFFQLGGHSLQAVRISVRLQEQYDIELPLRRLFEATTIAQLAAALEEAIRADVAGLSDAEIEALLTED